MSAVAYRVRAIPLVPRVECRLTPCNHPATLSLDAEKDGRIDVFPICRAHAERLGLVPSPVPEGIGGTGAPRGGLLRFPSATGVNPPILSERDTR